MFPSRRIRFGGPADDPPGVTAGQSQATGDPRLDCLGQKHRNGFGATILFVPPDVSKYFLDSTEETPGSRPRGQPYRSPPNPKASAVPIIESRLTSVASSASLRPSVPSGRRGITR